MNGTINVRSYYGSGSVFSIEIPQKISNIVDNNSNDNNITYDNKTILLVDDDELNNKVLSRLLSKYNIKLSTCKNGSECIDKINNNEKYDLIFIKKKAAAICFLFYLQGFLFRYITYHLSHKIL